MKDTDAYTGNIRKAWKGRALVVIKSNKNAGQIKLKVGSAAKADATLKAINLSVSSIDSIFDPELKEYTVYIPKGITSFEVTGIPTNAAATVEGNGTVNVSGNGDIRITSYNVCYTKLLRNNKKY